MNREKYVFHLDKWNFELIGYSAHTLIFFYKHTSETTLR